jgi:hypothetical protein
MNTAQYINHEWTQCCLFSGIWDKLYIFYNTVLFVFFRKAVKATVLLFPLLGMTYVIFIWPPSNDRIFIEVHQYINAFLQSFQVSNTDVLIRLFISFMEYYWFCIGHSRHIHFMKLPSLFWFLVSPRFRLINCKEVILQLTHFLFHAHALE